MAASDAAAIVAERVEDRRGGVDAVRVDIAFLFRPTPRFFTLDPSADRVLVANEDSDGIVSFARDPDSGRLLEPSPVARTGSPTCLLVGAG